MPTIPDDDMATKKKLEAAKAAPNRSREVQITLWLSAEERERWDEDAGLGGYDRSSFIRQACREFGANLRRKAAQKKLDD